MCACRPEVSALAAHNKSGVESVGQDAAHNESAALDSDHLGDAFIGVEAHQFLSHFFQASAVFEEGGDVFELDAGLGEIGNVSQMREQQFLFS